MTDDLTEAWRPVVGWEGIYSVSDLGRVRSEQRIVPRRGASPQFIRERFLKPGLHTGGYLSVALCRDAKPRMHFVHKLVLEAFVGVRPEGMEARHLDGNPANPALSNLAWGTPVENAGDRERHGTQVRGERVTGAKLTPEQVRHIRRDPRPQHVIASEHGVTQTAISHIKLGRIWRHVE